MINSNLTTFPSLRTICLLMRSQSALGRASSSGLPNQAKALLTLFANGWVCNRQTGLAEAVATKQTHIAAGFLLTITALWIAIPRTTLFSFARRVRFEQDDQFGDSLNFFLLLGCLRTCFIEPYDQVAKYRTHGFFVHLAFNTRDLHYFYCAPTLEGFKCMRPHYQRQN